MGIILALEKIVIFGAMINFGLRSQLFSRSYFCPETSIIVARLIQSRREKTLKSLQG